MTKKKRWRRFKSIVLALSLLIALTLVSLAIWHSRRTRLAELKRPPAGQFIDVGGHKLHYLVRGEGTPVVVMDSGLGEAGSTAWFGADEDIAEFARVVTYDRAGVGWSDPAAAPRSCDKEVEELRDLLRGADLQGPYLLVGHSRGGYNMRLFACLYPKEVVGVILIDAFNTDTFADDAPVAEIEPLFKFVYAARHFGAARAFYHRLVKDASKEIHPDVVQLYVDIQSRSSNFEAFCQGLKGQSNWRELRSKLYKLKDMPVTVISAKKTAGDYGWSWWTKAQDSLAASVSDNVQVVTLDCGHMVTIERPDVIVEAVRTMLKRIDEKQ